MPRWEVVDIIWRGPVIALMENARRPETILDQTGEIIKSGVKASFEMQGRQPDGGWQARKVPNIAGIFSDFEGGSPEPKDRRFVPRPALQDTGRLKNSIDHEIDPELSMVKIGTNLPYAGKHQFGAENELVGTITPEFQTWLERFLNRSQARASGGGAAEMGAFADIAVELSWMLNPQRIGTEIRIDIPARPFVTVTREDIEDIREMIGDLIAVLPSSAGTL